MKNVTIFSLDKINNMVLRLDIKIMLKPSFSPIFFSSEIQSQGLEYMIKMGGFTYES